VDVQPITVLEEASVPTINFGADELDGDFLAEVGGQVGGVLDVVLELTSTQ
jgi:hypothetical protein